MAGPLILLYGVSIYIAKIFNPEVPEDEEEELEEIIDDTK